MNRAVIIPAADMAALADIDALRAAAERSLAEARVEAARLTAAALDEARQRGLAEATRSATRVLAQAQGAADRKLMALEPTVARLVAQLVAQVVGDMDRDEAVALATARALDRMRDHRRARIAAAPDVVEAVRAAVAQMDGAGAEVIDVAADPRLEPGRAMLSSDDGHAEIGLDDLVRGVTQPFEAHAPEVPA